MQCKLLKVVPSDIDQILNYDVSAAFILFLSIRRIEQTFCISFVNIYVIYMHLNVTITQPTQLQTGFASTRVAKCQIFYTEQIFQTKFYPKISA